MRGWLLFCSVHVPCSWTRGLYVCVCAKTITRVVKLISKLEGSAGGQGSWCKLKRYMRYMFCLVYCLPYY